MSSPEIITNHVPQQLIYGSELTVAERQDFNYIEDIDSHDFFRYRGRVYDPDEFMYAGTSFPGWEGYSSDSYFSGILIHYIDDEHILVGRYYF